MATLKTGICPKIHHITILSKDKAPIRETIPRVGKRWMSINNHSCSEKHGNNSIKIIKKRKNDCEASKLWQKFEIRQTNNYLQIAVLIND